VQVAGIKRHFHPATVYNFVVAANGGVEVHNTCAWDSESLLNHWGKHAGEFSEYQSAADYEFGAQRFFENPNNLSKIRPNGDTVFFNEGTNEFGVLKANGAPKTYFKPDPSVHGFPTNLDYFNAQ
jgi:filamentous hemagglutinin